MGKLDHEPEPNAPDTRKTMRRKEDRDRCNMCSFIWEHHDKEREAYREITCGKITKLEKSQEAGIKDMRESHSKDIKDIRDNMVGRWAFGVFVTLILALSVGLNGWIGSSVKEGQIQLKHDIETRQEEVKKSLETIHRRISTSDDQQQNSMQLVNEKLAKIENSASVMEWRLGQVERKLGVTKGP